ncbi:hypothetical protein SAMN05443287_103615 [Micromonospora phaseoli]|uniref:Uncharacterized protein n=1 Tax=Micromonospora phaseoli TaxID=1144548 RepID=A0A1H6XK46_9ACTN|nr:hypothetical protein CLV64_102613 [Micromonospora phaseoli]GIJ75758.1 hypothetical protein Xph01_01900 [Micromonospora phaseoli]SEJ27914.1 hypothetical protein SAMN05443287_103615 [Micromonospora phaseoli]
MVRPGVPEGNAGGGAGAGLAGVLAAGPLTGVLGSDAGPVLCLVGPAEVAGALGEADGAGAVGVIVAAGTATPSGRCSSVASNDGTAIAVRAIAPASVLIPVSCQPRVERFGCGAAPGKRGCGSATLDTASVGTVRLPHGSSHEPCA